MVLYVTEVFIIQINVCSQGREKRGKCAQWDLEARVVPDSQDTGAVGAEVEVGRLAGPGRRAFAYDLVCAPKRKLQRGTCSTSVLLIREPGPAAHVVYPLFLSQRGKDPHGIGHQPASPADGDAGLRVTWGGGLFSELCPLPNHRKLYYPLCISRPCKKSRFCKTRFCFLGKAKFRKSEFLAGQQIG